MKKLKNGHHFINIDHMENFQITDPSKVWVSGFPNVIRNRISESAITEISKKWLPFCKYQSYRKFSNYHPPKVRISSFLSVNRNGISPLAIMKKMKNACHFINIDHTEKFQITDPPKFGSLVFQVSTEMEYQCQLL